jgi:CRISPR-associated protein Csx17
MTELVLPGCRTTPLAGYLSSLGLLRAVTRTLDSDAAGYWRQQRFVLVSRFESITGLVETLADTFTPEMIVSPWNAGSGFAGNGRNTTAEAALRRVRASTDSRWAPLRDAIAAADRVVVTGRARGWSGRGEELWDKARKADVLALCRAELPDAALSWLDAAVALGADDDPAFSRLLGTGGNFGRQDLSATYLARADVAVTDTRGSGWLSSLLTGDETVPYLRDAVGQFDPSRAGGIQSSPWEKRDDKGFVNPWAFLLTIEGTLLFASAVVRRHGAQYAHAALPFQVSGSTGAHDSAAANEQVLSEIWAPEWSTPLGVDDLAHLLGEGRAEWRRRPARSGLDFVRAIASLGVDRGIDAFQRHVVVDRWARTRWQYPPTGWWSKNAARCGCWRGWIGGWTRCAVLRYPTRSRSQFVVWNGRCTATLQPGRTPTWSRYSPSPAAHTRRWPGPGTSGRSRRRWCSRTGWRWPTN